MKEEGKETCNTGRFNQEGSPKLSQRSWATKHFWGHLKHEGFTHQFYHEKKEKPIMRKRFLGTERRRERERRR